MEYAKIAEVRRGPAVESVHFGAAAVANAAGEVIYGWGDTGIVTFPRSSLKPIQAIALVETGAADAFGRRRKTWPWPAPRTAASRSTPRASPPGSTGLD